MKIKPIYRKRPSDRLSKSLYIIENTNFKEGIDHNHLIELIKGMGVNTVEFVSYLYTIEGRKDMVISIDNDKDKYIFRRLIYHDNDNYRWYRSINRPVIEWKYYGMGKVYNPKDIKTIHDKFKIRTEER